MDNKLSELSKPVGYAAKEDIELMQSGRMTLGLLTIRGYGEHALYSQEYVSALLQDISTLEQVLRHIHGAALDITVPRAAIAKAAEYATKKENRNG